MTHPYKRSEGVLGWYSSVPVCLLPGDEQIEREQLELKVEDGIAFTSEPYHD